MSNEQKPVVALVHGAFAESASWNGVIERLLAKSLEAVAIGNPLRSVASDAAYVRDAIAGIGRPVVLVGHSYGGFVVTEAAANNPSVLGLVYVCAFAPDHGETAFGLSTRFPGSTLGNTLATYPLSSGGKDLAIKRELFHQQFAADVSAGQAALMAATQRPATEAALTDALPTKAPGWKSVPSWFVFGERDVTIPVGVHRFCAERAGSRRTNEVAGASHAIAVSRPELVAEMILEAVEGVSKRAKKAA